MIEDRKIQTFAQLSQKKDITGEEIVTLFGKFADEGRGVQAKEVMPLLQTIQLTPEQLGGILVSCTVALLRVRAKKADWYYSKLPEMSELRWIRETAQKMFDRVINQEPELIP